MPRGDFGFNGYISAAGAGSRRVRVTQLRQSLGIIASTGESRRRRSFYPVVTTGSSFSIELAFLTYAARESFAKWFRGYIESVLDNTARTGVMTVAIPNQDFLTVCVPNGPIEYGDSFDAVGYTLSLSFGGASDPLDTTGLTARQAGASYFKLPHKYAYSKVFYPAGQQVKGAESLEGTIFDPVASEGDTGPAPIEDY